MMGTKNYVSNEIATSPGRCATAFAAMRKPHPGDYATPISHILLTLSHAVVALSVLSVLAGCAIWSGDAVRYHIIDYPTPKQQSDAPIPETLMVYRFLLADSVDIHYLVITSADDDHKVVSRQRWEFDPSDMLTELIQRDLEASGLFEKTVDQWSNSPYRYALEGTIQRLEGVIKDGKAAAELKVEVTFTDFESPLGARKDILKKEYTIKVPSVDSKSVSIVRAVNLAVRELSERIRDDIAKSLKDKDDLELDKPDHQQPAVKVSAAVFQKGISVGRVRRPHRHRWGNAAVPLMLLRVVSA